MLYRTANICNIFQDKILSYSQKKLSLLITAGFNSIYFYFYSHVPWLLFYICLSVLVLFLSYIFLFWYDFRVSVQFSGSVMSNFLQLHGLQHDRCPCPSPTPRACSNSCPSSQWYHPTISSSVVTFSSCLQSFPASGSFPVSHFFTSDGQILEFPLQHQSFQWIFRTDFL